MSFSYEEKIMRDLCKEYNIEWVDTANSPLINNQPIMNFEISKLIEDFGYLIEYNNDDIHAVDEIVISAIGELTNEKGAHYTANLEGPAAA